MEHEDYLLENAVINQFVVDVDEGDYTAISEMLGRLMENEDNKKILIEFLGDTAKENWMEQKTVTNY